MNFLLYSFNYKIVAIFTNFVKILTLNNALKKKKPIVHMYFYVDIRTTIVETCI